MGVVSSEPIDPVEAALVAGMHALGAGGPGMAWPGTAESLLGTFDDQCTSRCEFATVCRVNQARAREKDWQPPQEQAP